MWTATGVIFTPSHSAKTLNPLLRFTSEGILSVSQKMSDESPHSDINTQPQGSPMPTATLYFVFRHGTEPAEVNYRRWYLHQQVFCWFIIPISVRQRDLHNTPRVPYKLWWITFLYLFLMGSPGYTEKEARGTFWFETAVSAFSDQTPRALDRLDIFHSIPFNGSNVPQHSVCRISKLFIGFWSDFFEEALRFLEKYFGRTPSISIRMCFISYFIHVPSTLYNLSNWQRPEIKHFCPSFLFLENGIDLS